MKELELEIYRARSDQVVFKGSLYIEDVYGKAIMKDLKFENRRTENDKCCN